MIEPTNPGGACGIGCAVYEGEMLIKEYSYFIAAKRENTNNIAEYMAFIRAFKHCIENDYQGKNILIQGDSQLCVKQLNGDWGIKSGAYVKYAYMAKDFLKKVKVNNRVMIEWIPRELNQTADDLSKKELINHGISITKRR